MNKNLPNELVLYPFGIVRQDVRLAAGPEGALVLLSGKVLAPDGATHLSFLVEYDLDEPLPRWLVLGGDLLLEVVRPAKLTERTRRCLLLSRLSTKRRELWLYLEPENTWAITTDLAWLKTLRDH